MNQLWDYTFKYMSISRTELILCAVIYVLYLPTEKLHLCNFLVLERLLLSKEHACQLKD